ncbi:transcription repressor OFP12-like [Lotus japonicus]|uniref:transcription repressor OFP12-like n=1 Tax=Lotus japonicus TaxID=34305 RepID=UPI00258AB90B|nr:transcription repressor OFP12-like [Lotus japonicus]
MPTTMQESESDVTRKRRSNYHNLRRLNLCFSSSTFTQPQTHPITSSSSSSSSLPQQQQHHNRPSPTTNATSSIMINNFNTTFYHHHHHTSSSSSSNQIEPEPESKPADFATAFASQRFFFSSPGRSNSIIERANTNSTAASRCNSNKSRQILDGSVAVPTYSPDPYADFLRSMQEMVEARPELLLTEEESSWEALHELLLCYLALNQKSTHKFILRAFSDLLVTVMSFSSPSSSPPPPPPPNFNLSGGGGGCKKS